MRARWNSRVFSSGLLLTIVLALAGSLGQSPAAHAGVIIVVDRGDDAAVGACTAAPNDCTLRGAIEYANSNGTFNIIRFDPGVQEVLLEQALPDIASQGTSIEGSDPSGTPFYPVINGIGIADISASIMITASDVALVYLSIVNMPPNGPDIDIETVSVTGVVIAFNRLGLPWQAASCHEPGMERQGYSAVRIAGALGGAAGPGNGTAYIYSNVIGCHNSLGSDAIELVDSNWVYVGQDRTGAAAPNYIGTDLAGSSLGNYAGVRITAWSDDGDLHDTVGPNFIANNDKEGIRLSVTYTVGILITGTTIYDNGGAGIVQRGGAAGNFWSHVSIYDNGGLGIDQGENGVPESDLPTITAVNPATGVISGTAEASLPPQLRVSVELYRVARDPSGYGEGKTYVGRASVDSGGHWAVTDPAGATGCYTAFQSVRVIGPILLSGSSEFGPNSCHWAFLPSVARNSP